MADETLKEQGADKATPAVEKPAVVKAAGRKYTYKGKKQINPAVFNQYGSVKIKPWSMTDAEIDACIKKHPDLARLWTVNG